MILLKAAGHNFTSKTEDKQETSKKSKVNSWQVPTDRGLYNQVVSTKEKKTFFYRCLHAHKEITRKRWKSYLTTKYNIMHFENRSRRRWGQKTSLFTNDQVPFIGTHYIIYILGRDQRWATNEMIMANWNKLLKIYKSILFLFEYIQNDHNIY